MKSAAGRAFLVVGFALVLPFFGRVLESVGFVSTIAACSGG